MARHKYAPTAIGLYINYFIHGIGAIILMQNWAPLAAQWGTDKAGVLYVGSSFGIGRLLTILVMGILSDKFGRKPFVYIGMLLYVIFFAGVLLSPNMAVAYVFGIIAGMANSTLDAGTNPALMESFPTAKGTASILVKASMSVAQTLYPFIIVFVAFFSSYYGSIFIFCAVILAANALYLIKMPFPDHRQAEAAPGDPKAAAAGPVFREKPKMWLEGVCIILIGYTSTATFYLVSQCLNPLGTDILGMNPAEASGLMFYYGTGSLIAAFATSYLVKSLVKPTTVLVIYPLVSFFALLVMFFFQTAAVIKIGSFVLGFFAAGGVLQLSMTAMVEFFPKGKGTMGALVYTCSSVATFSIPVVAGYLTRSYDISYTLLFDAVVTGVGVLLALVVMYRYRKVFGNGKRAKA